MSGTREGGLKAAKTNKKRYGDGFYTRIGALGGKKSKGGAFSADPELARVAGRIGGLVSRRGGVRNENSRDELEAAKKALAKFQRGVR